MKSKVKLTIAAIGLLALPLSAFATTGTIDSVNKYAWGSNTGYVNFNPTNGNVVVTSSGLTGDIWSDTYGWINLNPSNAGVTNDGNGNLSGYAWGEGTGYISFAGVTINTSTGIFQGTATGTIVGTINFNCSNCEVETTWAPTVSPTPTPTPSGGGGGGGGGGGCCYVALTPTSNASASSTVASTSLTFPVPAPLSLVNENGTFYLIQNGQLRGITSPGILYSYGFAFSDATSATPADLALAQGSLLLPNSGALVKSKADHTVYLVSDGRRYAFTSAKVFKALGFKFSSVLLVTNPELQALPLGADISNASAAHMDGFNISYQGTIYWISGRVRYPYPSVAVYNSWNLQNDFSKVIPANKADLNLPVGLPIPARVVD
jgi:hypothetical protein